MSRSFKVNFNSQNILSLIDLDEEGVYKYIFLR